MIKKATPWKAFQAAAARLISVVEVTGMAHRCRPADVDRLTAEIVKHGGKIFSVDGVRVPNGYSGACYFDSESDGPYWPEEL